MRLLRGLYLQDTASLSMAASGEGLIHPNIFGDEIFTMFDKIIE